MRLRFEVVDTGIGIPADKRAQLFQAFQQLDSSDARRHGGTGLGLAISRRLVEMMGGRMDVESEEGKGSTFWFGVTLPVAADTGPAEAKAKLAGMRVLVLEDHPINQRLTLLSLGKLGCRAEAVTTGEEMLKRLNAEPWEVVVFPPGRTAIVCILSSESLEIRENLERAGAHGFLARPFNLHNWSKR